MRNKSIKLSLIVVVMVALFVTIVLLILNKDNITKDNDIKQDEIAATAVNNIVEQNNNIIKENLEILSIRTETNLPITSSTNKYEISDGKRLCKSIKN